MRSEGYDLIHDPLEGEILQVSKGSGKGFFGKIYYDVMVTLPNGARHALHAVPQMSVWGGIGNYVDFRLNTRDDGSDINSVKDDQTYAASTGDRVVVVFLGGSIHRPVIAGYLSHPQQTHPLKNHESIDPQMAGEYNGIHFRIDSIGQFQLIHHGAPDVNFVTQNAASKALAATGNPALTLLEPNAPQPNASLDYPDTSGTTVLDMLDGGGFSIRDTEGQQIMIDRLNNQMFFTNSGTSSLTNKPVFRGKTTVGEQVLLKFDEGLLSVHARSTLKLYSDDAFKVISGGDYTATILGDTSYSLAGDRSTKIDGDDSYLISGDSSTKLGGKQSLTIAGDSSWSIVGQYSLVAEQGVSIKEAISSITLNKGTVAIKGTTGELLDLISQILTQLQIMTVETVVGTSTPPVNAPVFAQIQTLLLGMKG